jgi:D-alanyl-lipoteichoic acid acyltransferase DltB (MBOAT superfamily)
MNFNSITFLFFLSAVIALYRLLPWRFGKPILVVASYLFYGNAEPWYCVLLLASTLTDFYVAQKIESSSDANARKSWLLLSVVINLGLLSSFKYGDFFLQNLNFGLAFFGADAIPLFGILLPVGISFYTFQTMSYTIDVYRGNAKAERNFWTFALFVAYFPQLVAGPIERAKNLIPQLREKHKVDGATFMSGVERILWGMIKKVVFADRIAVFVNEVYAAAGEQSALVISLAMVGFMFQLYLDFSGYTDIAIGTARLMGVKLTENFRWPFVARNPTDFWNRWNRTLTSWFTDYLFRPMGGLMRGKPVRSILNTLIVFSATGLWHGASWNFVFFGFFAGIMVAYYQTVRLYLFKGHSGPLLGRNWWSAPLAVALNAPFIYLIGVFFRSPDIAHSKAIYLGLFSNNWRLPETLIPYAILISFVYVVHVVRSIYVPKLERGELKLDYPRAVWAFVLLFILMMASYQHKETFIYFQF